MHPLLFSLASLIAAQDASPDLDATLALIRPTEQESGWSKIAWQLDLGEARRKAAAEGKPLFVWSMSGEPLGQC